MQLVSILFIRPRLLYWNDNYFVTDGAVPGPSVKSKRKRYTCNICNKSYSAKSLLNFLIKNVHEQTTENTVCFLCDKRFSSTTAMKNHQRVVHMEDYPHQCNHCTKKFQSKRDLNSHIGQHHDNGNSMSCKNCNKQFAYKNSLGRHVSVCGLKRTTFKCSFCEKSFHLKDTLRNHVQAKHGEHSHICDMCGKHFEWKSSYRRHLKNVHKDDNPDATVNNWMNTFTLLERCTCER